MLILFGATIFVGASLLFLVQPMFARMALPLLGGAPAVWNTAMVFYQAVLLAGYAYAHVTTRWLGARRQAGLHLVVLLVPLARAARSRCRRAGSRRATRIPSRGSSRSSPWRSGCPSSRSRRPARCSRPGSRRRATRPPAIPTSSMRRATSAACSALLALPGGRRAPLRPRRPEPPLGVGLRDPRRAGRSPAPSRSGGRGAAHRGDERGGERAGGRARPRARPPRPTGPITPRAARALGRSWPPSRPA